MPKTYGTVTTFTAGSVLTAAQLNVAGGAVNNLVVPSSVSVYRATSNQSVSVGSNFQWNAVTYDTDATSWSAGNPDRVYLNTAGLYLVNWGYYVNYTGTNTAWQVNLNLFSAAGASVAGWAVQYDAAGYGTRATIIHKGSQIVSNATAGQYMALNLTAATGATCSLVASGDSFFQATWIGRTS